MARRRMITLDIYDSDSFLDMPTEAQNLFTHFVARADDDGFISNPKRIRRMLGYGEDAFKLLIAKGYVYEFTSGFVVVAAWRSMNRVEPSKKTQTTAKYELAQLTEVNKIYELAENADLEAFTDDTRKILESRGFNSRKVLAQVRLGQGSLGKDSLGKSSSRAAEQKTAPTTDLQNLVRFYEENFGVISPLIVQELKYDLEEFSYDVVLESLKKTIFRQKTFSYHSGILNSWNKKGIKTVEDIKADDVSFGRKTGGRKDKVLEHRPDEWDDVPTDNDIVPDFEI